MGILIAEVTEPTGLLLAAAASASAGVTDLIEVARDDADHGAGLRHREAAENLADALQSVLSVELAGPDLPADRRGECGQLLAAVSRFLEGWA